MEWLKGQADLEGPEEVKDMVSERVKAQRGECRNLGVSQL